MSCTFTHDDAAYVLGALSPSDRLEFERHLAHCADCARAVRELAGLPGLLGRVDPTVLTVPPADDPLPATLLPQLARSARRVRRRRSLVAAGAAATAAAILAPLVVGQLHDGDQGSTPPVAGTPEAGADARPMDPVGDVPVQAEIDVEAVMWGTKLQLICRYDTTWVSYRLPPEVDYVLVVRTEDGRTERVGSWRSVDGRTMQLTAGTAARTADIARVEVLTRDGRVVLTSQA